jgi:hypothetical protein
MATTPKDTAPVTEPPSYHVVTIWHNVEMHDGRAMGFDGYVTGQAMAPVFTYPAPHSTATPDEAFRLFNAPEEYLRGADLAIVRRYRALRLRSLSIGDIVQAADQFYVCERDGWAKLGTNVELNVQPDPYEQWSGDADTELTRARRGYARAAFNAVLAKTNDETLAMRAFYAIAGDGKD